MMLDPVMLNIDFLVEQLLKTDKPDVLLSRLSPDIRDVFVPPKPSKYLFFEGDPLPLPTISNKEREGLREEMDKAFARLTEWEEDRFVAAASATLDDYIPKETPTTYKDLASSLNSNGSLHHGTSLSVGAPGVVPRLPLDKLVQSDMKVVGESPESPYAGFLRSPRTQWENLITEPADKLVRKLPSCVYSSSPQVSKSFKPSAAAVAVPSVQDSNSTVETNSTVVSAGKTGSSQEDSEASEWTFSESSNSGLICELGESERMPDHLELQGSEKESSLSSSHLERDSSIHGEEATPPTRTILSSQPNPTLPASVASSTRTETSPPSSKVLRHLEALEAAIELDSTLNSFNVSNSAKRRLDLESPPPPSEGVFKRPQTLQLAGKVGKRRLPQPQQSAYSPLVSVSTVESRSHTASERSHTASERSHTGSQNEGRDDDTEDEISFASESPERKSISFYIAVENTSKRNLLPNNKKSPMRPRSATVKSPIRRGAVTRPRSATTMTSKQAEPPAEYVTPGNGTIPGETSNVTSVRRIRHDSYTISTENDIKVNAGRVITKTAIGFLCRALIRSNKVQQHIKTIQDTNDLLKGYTTLNLSKEDKAFYNTLQNTLTQTKEKIAVIFFATTRTVQLSYIANSRNARREKQSREISQKPTRKGSKKMRQKAWI